MAKLTEYDFTLTLAGVKEITPDIANRFFEAGCDDALFGVRDGVAFADFTREAMSFSEAVLSAIRDIRKAQVGATVVRVEPDDLVTMADIADRTQRTRESVRKLIIGERGPGEFPAPVARVKQKSPLWRWVDVVAWLNAAPPPKTTEKARATTKTKMLKDIAKAKAKTKAEVHHQGSFSYLSTLQPAEKVVVMNAVLDLRRYADRAEAKKLLDEVFAQ